jgi:hypothetical protein
MAELTDAQRKRSEARAKRRSEAQNEEHEAPDETQNDSTDGSAAAVGAAAAAARALTSHQADDGAEESENKETEVEESAQQLDSEEQPEAREQDPEAEPEVNERRQEEEEPVSGAEAGDARAALDNARELLEELHGKPVEAASSLERTHEGWVVALEVVELSRVPESTDILASYEVELDDDLNFRRYEQVRRYHRGSAERSEGA